MLQPWWEAQHEHHMFCQAGLCNNKIVTASFAPVRDMPCHCSEDCGRLIRSILNRLGGDESLQYRHQHIRSARIIFDVFGLVLDDHHVFWTSGLVSLDYSHAVKIGDGRAENDRHRSRKITAGLSYVSMQSSTCWKFRLPR